MGYFLNQHVFVNPQFILYLFNPFFSLQSFVNPPPKAENEQKNNILEKSLEVLAQLVQAIVWNNSQRTQAMVQLKEQLKQMANKMEEKEKNTSLS